jgi:hypothetical protein
MFQILWNHLAFQSFGNKCKTRIGLQKRVVHIIFDIHVFIKRCVFPSCKPHRRHIISAYWIHVALPFIIISLDFTEEDTITCYFITGWHHTQMYEQYRGQHYVIKFISDLRQVGGIPRVIQVSSTNKTNRHYIT